MDKQLFCWRAAALAAFLAPASLLPAFAQNTDPSQLIEEPGLNEEQLNEPQVTGPQLSEPYTGSSEPNEQPAVEPPPLAEPRARMGDVPSSAASTPTTISADEVTLRARISRVDPAKRQLTVQAENGKTFTIHADPSLGSLDHLKPGDTIIARYFDSVALWVDKASAAPGAPPQDVSGKATPGSQVSVVPAKQRPESVTANVISQRATVESVDVQHKKLTLRSADGQTYTVKFDDSAGDINSVHVGDSIVTRQTEIVAIDVIHSPGSTSDLKAPQERSAVNES